MIICSTCQGFAVPKRLPGLDGTPRRGDLVRAGRGRYVWECGKHPDASCVEEPAQ